MSEALPGRLLAVVGMGVPGRFRRPGTDGDGPRAVLGHRPGGQETPGGRGARHEGQQSVTGGGHIGLGPGHHVRPRRGEDIGESILQRLTLVIDEAAKIKPLQEAIMAEAEERSTCRLAGSIPAQSTSTLTTGPTDPDELKEVQGEGPSRIAKRKRGQGQDQGGNGNGKDSDWRPEPTRVTLGLSGSTYRYGAIKTGASVSEREITLPTKLVDEVCTELSSERVLSMQLERGQFLGQLILPEDLRPILATNAPLVMMLDSTTARIPWEMVALRRGPRQAGRLICRT